MTEQTNNSASPVEPVDKPSLLSSLVSDPQVMDAFNEKLQSMVGQKSEFIAFLPVSIKRRLKALKRLQLESFKVEAQYFEEVQKLQCKFQTLYEPLFEKRKDITSAAHEPTDEECDYEEVEEEEEEKDGEKEAVKDEKDDDKKKSIFTEDTKGIPEFWLTIFKNIPSIAKFLSEEDEDALKSLKDVRVEHSSDGFKLFFDFEANDYFEQTTLTKEYILRMEVDQKSPMLYEGPEIIKCHGCEVRWKEGKDLTVDKEASKKVSFFHFFKPPVIQESMEEGEEKEELEDELLLDYDTGHMLQSSVIPRAVLYYTGEALDDDDDDYDCSDEEDEDDDEEGDDDDNKDPDWKPKKGAKNECKQQ